MIASTKVIEATNQVLIITSNENGSQFTFADSNDMNVKQTFEVAEKKVCWIRAIETNVEGEEEMGLNIVLFHSEY